MSDNMLREKIAREVSSERVGDEDNAYTMDYAIADRILALLEIANGQALLSAKMDELGIGAGCVRIERIDPADLYIKPDETESASPPA